MKATVTHRIGYRCTQGSLGTWCHSCKCLLASAPALLEMLKTVHNEGAGLHYDAIHVLIRQAEGRYKS